MNEQWEELKETIIELRDNDGTGTQQEVCGFLANLMDVLEKQEQEPCEEEDIISRENVITTLQADPFFTCSGDQLNAIRIVEGMPSVTPQLKTGHWIKYGVPRCGEQHYQCTSCEYYINFGQWGELYAKEFKYCPNCGAKMKIKE